MVFVWLAAVPLGVIIAMFGRQYNMTWWPKAHMSIMAGAVAMPLTTAAIAAFAVAGKINAKPHSLLGTIIVFGAWIQITLGVVNHLVYRYRHKNNNVPLNRPWNNSAHIWLGRLLTALAFINIPLGMRIKQSSVSLYVGFAIWTALLVFVFLGLTWNKYKRTSEARCEMRAKDEASIG
ncbi:hypothetical protein DFQ30_007143 [Apophysomyces sp. BC1015]|nr:hypothetical protein DFQ30_007143 [Apophysomyces sp. BC1015]